MDHLSTWLAYHLALVAGVTLLAVPVLALDRRALGANGAARAGIVAAMALCVWAGLQALDSSRTGSDVAPLAGLGLGLLAMLSGAGAVLLTARR